MKIANLVTLVACISVAAAAQDIKSDEAAIRALISDANSGKQVPGAPDVVFWSGAYARPSIGKEVAPEKKGPRQISKRVPGSVKTVVTPSRIEVSKSGDMAWEFSRTETSFDLKDGTKVRLEGSTLRVWHKDGSGRWSIAAQFIHPHEE